MNGHIRLVVFDIGGVLVRAGRTLADDIEHAGYQVDGAWLQAFESRLAGLPRRSTGAIDNATYLPLFASTSGGRFSIEDAQRISDSSLRGEYEGIGRVFDALERAGIRTAALSNANDAEWSRLFPAMGTWEFPRLRRITHRFISYQLGVTKPDPLAFAAVEAETGFSDSAVLFFDDRIENVVAARRHGWLADLIDHNHETAEQLLSLLDQRGLR